MPLGLLLLISPPPAPLGSPPPPLRGSVEATRAAGLRQLFSSARQLWQAGSIIDAPQVLQGRAGRRGTGGGGGKHSFQIHRRPRSGRAREGASRSSAGSSALPAAPARGRGRRDRRGLSGAESQHCPKAEAHLSQQLPGLNRLPRRERGVDVGGATRFLQRLEGSRGFPPPPASPWKPTGASSCLLV